MTAAAHELPLTIEDVARRAGVSYQTVSRVVNNAGPVRASTRARVEEAIADLVGTQHSCTATGPTPNIFGGAR